MTASGMAKGEGEALVCVGEFAGPHGVRGIARVRSFTAEPEDVAAYGPVSTLDGQKRFQLEIVGQGPRGNLLVKIAGLNDRDQVALLTGTKLYVARALLPPPEEEEFYHADLIGCAAALEDGTRLGVIKAIFEAGGGDVLEIARPGADDVLVPFTKLAVPRIDLAARLVIVDPPVLVDVRPAIVDAADGEISA